MKQSNLAPIAVPFRDDSMKIVAMHWNDTESTQIDVISTRTERIFTVEFESVAGMRMLSEIDLASTWMNADHETFASTWLFKVNAGGWMELESTRNDFYTQHAESKPYEFLIVGYQECVSIFSFSLPVVHERAPNNSFKGRR